MDHTKPGPFADKMDLENELTNKFLSGEMSFAEYSSEWYEHDDEEEAGARSPEQPAQAAGRALVRRRKGTRLTPALLGLMGEANLRFVRGDKETAEKMCHEIIKQVPNAPEPYQTLAQIYENDPDKSMQFSLLAAHLSPSDATEWLRLAALSKQRNDVKQEMLCYTQAIKADPHNLANHMKRLELFISLEEAKYPVHTLCLSRVKCYHKIATSMPPTEGETIMKYAKMAATLYHNNNELENALVVMTAAYNKCANLFSMEDTNIFLELLISQKQYQTCIEVFVANAGVEIEAEIQTIENAYHMLEEQTNYLNCTLPNSLPIDLKSKLLVCFIHLGATNLVETLLADFLTNNVEKAGDLYMDIEEALSSVGLHHLALKLLEPLVQNPSFDLGAVWLKHAECLYNLGRQNEAIDSYYKVLQHAPQHAEARRRVFVILESQGRVDEALDILQQDYKYVVSASLLYEHCCALKKYGRMLKYLQNCSLFPVMRLLLPALDRERGAYHLKETSLGSTLVRVLALPPTSADALRLTSYRSVGNAQDSDLAGVAYFVLKNRFARQPGSLTVKDANEVLDKIANAQVGGKARVLDEAFGTVFRQLSADQLKWFLRIVLKDLRLRIGHARILAAMHPDAPEYYDSCSNLLKTCSELEPGSARPLELGVQVFCAVSPMLSERLDVTRVLRLPPASYIVEDKFDGERFQIHMQDGVFEYFSRKGHSYGQHYGTGDDSGLLTPQLRAGLAPGVTSVVLDGEMMGWHKQRQLFGSKGMSFDVKKITVNSAFQPCFCAFDVLHYNGRNLAGPGPADAGGAPLRERLAILDSIITDVPGVLLRSKRRPVTDLSEILEALNRAIEDQEEGIVVKDLDSYYLANRRNAGWYKVKPEYTEGTMVELDLVVVGAEEASDKRRGRARSFHVACADGAPGCPHRWVVVGRVATGLTFEQRETLCATLERHWVSRRHAPPPACLVFNKEKPDFWVMPEHSIILQVRATELIRSTDFGTSHTLRFPRVTAVRDDKPTTDAMPLVEFNALVKDGSVVKLSKRPVAEEALETGAAAPRRKRTARALEVPAQFRTQPIQDVEVVSAALRGREICVVSGDEASSKADLVRMVRSHGGRHVENVGPSTWCCVAGRRVFRAHSAQARDVDIASAAWLRSLQPSDVPAELTPLDLLTASRSTKLNMCHRYDRFGDSYVDATDEETLRRCFMKVDEVSDEDIIRHSCSHYTC
ncbi:DNA ligase 4-like [Cydia splendana]|uniref:DNA ligase 4-like n=1 Tax=Cydia splendana TaxID=1100963 RepID=UPI00300C206E